MTTTNAIARLRETVTESEKKLSPSQIDTLGGALAFWNVRHWIQNDNGWFWPDRHKCADVITTPQTCKSLCGLGLLEFKTWDYIKRRGEWIPVNKYRITQAGIERYQVLEKQAANANAAAVDGSEGGGG